MRYVTFIVLLFIIGCITSKNKSSTIDEKTETIHTRTDSTTMASYDSLHNAFMEYRSETETKLEFSQENNDVLSNVIAELQQACLDSSLTADSLRKLMFRIKCPEVKVKYNSDGSFEVTGQKLRSLNITISQLLKSLDSVRVQKAMLETVNADLHHQLYQKKTIEVKEKKGVSTGTLIFWGIFLLMVGIVVGAILGYRIKSRFSITQHKNTSL